jgi:hypothetical protein
MKKILFWVLSPIMFPLFLLSNIMQGFGESLEALCYWFENWCFNYDKNRIYYGNGIYRYKDKVDDSD